MRTDSRSYRRLFVRVSSLGVLFGVCLSVAAVATAQTGARRANRNAARELACGPQAGLTRPSQALKVIGGEPRGKALFGTGESVVINGGTAQGLRAGQEYFVRRVVPDQFAQRMIGTEQTFSIHTAGWVKIVEVQTDFAVATITHGCDGVSEGDYLEPFVLPAPPASRLAGGEPDFSNPGHIVLGDERRQSGAVGDMMVMDRGSDHGLRAGQKLTIYRDLVEPGGPVVRVAEATVVIVRPENSTIRIETSRDAVYVGDRVAIHR
jgi:hypothetical protein